jgi:hypothetical protein
LPSQLSFTPIIFAVDAKDIWRGWMTDYVQFSAATGADCGSVYQFRLAEVQLRANQCGGALDCGRSGDNMVDQ